MKRTLSLIFTLALSVAFAGCGGKGGSTSGPSDNGTGGTGGSDGGTGGGTSIGSTVARNPQSGGNFLDVTTFPNTEIVSGCPGVDCIPALTDPSFVDPSSAEASYLLDTDIVMGLVINGEAKAYPHNIGWWHEIVNDEVGGHPVMVTLCPLTGTGMVFDGVDVAGERFYNGVSGLLFNNNLVMYDRPATGPATLFPQMIYKGISGPRTGESLNLLPVMETTWGYWKQLYPATKVISGETGVYDRSFYVSYPYIQSGADYRIVNEFLMYPLFPSFDSNQTSRFFEIKDLTLVLLCQLMDRLVSFWQTGGYQWTSKHRQTLCPS